MKRIYIIEGLNGSGKATLANGVAKELDMYESRLPLYETPTGEKIKEAIKNGKEGLLEIEFQKLMYYNYLEALEIWKKQER